MSQADPIKKTDAARYVKVIVPVRLDRVLTYSVPESLSGKVGIGSRVKVRLGPRLTDAVVCLTDVTPDIDPQRIHAIEGVDEGLERITPEEIRLWQFIADYYLCSQGEVFKCAYPSGKIRSEETAARVRERAEASRRKLQEAARERVAKLEAEIEAVRVRTQEALSKLGEKAVKTREKLTANRDARLERLEEALAHARAAIVNMEAGARVGAGGSALPGNAPCRALPPAPRKMRVGLRTNRRKKSRIRMPIWTGMKGRKPVHPLLCSKPWKQASPSCCKAPPESGPKSISLSSPKPSPGAARP